jgi:nitrite reductase/ring-hydroxylating ferredoxin subunit
MRPSHRILESTFGGPVTEAPNAHSGRALRLCLAADVADGEIRRVELEGHTPLAVYNVGGTLFVSDDTCSHGEASLSEGMLTEDGRIECPWHTGSFCLRTGEALTSPADVPIRVYPVALENGTVYIHDEDAA